MTSADKGSGGGPVTTTRTADGDLLTPIKTIAGSNRNKIQNKVVFIVRKENFTKHKTCAYCA